MRLCVPVLAVLLSLAVCAGAQAAPSPAPGVTAVKIGSAELAHAAVGRLRSQSKRVARLPSHAGSALVAARQDVVVRRGPVDAASRLGCDARPISVYRVSGDVTPRGVITVSGSCFGTRAGAVDLLGSGLPDGTVHLAVRSWSDGAVTASVPAITAVADQAVQLRVSKTTFGLANSGDRTRPIASTTTTSEPVPMRFVAARETVIVPMNWFANASCGDNIVYGFTTKNNYDDCLHFESTDGFTGWAGAFDFHNPAYIGDHVRPAANVTGQDTWQASLPAGWLFDRVEFFGGAADTDVAITPTLDTAHVSWRVHWKTAHVVDEYGAREEATYAIVMFATGPAGMAYKRTQ